MIGVLMATHGKMAEGIYDATQMIFGKRENFDYVTLESNMDIDIFGENLGEKVKELDSGDGVIILVDLLGASPMNQAALFMSENPKIEVITGINLPMVLDILESRKVNNDVIDIVKDSIEVTKDSIVRVREKL